LLLVCQIELNYICKTKSARILKIIEKNTWKRLEYFNFFSGYADPFFGLIANLDCSNAFRVCKKNNFSFFAYYLHKSLLAVNDTEEFRYRTNGNDIILYDKVHAASTIGREDGSFGFSFIPHSSDFNEFCRKLNQEVKAVKESTGVRYLKESERIDVIHYSTIPWLSFTGLKHPGNFRTGDSAPKIVFGKSCEQNNRLLLPVAVHAHHGFVDGKHISDFFQAFQDYMDM
jgi:chloramphenicol O-acetyltransferase type A